MNGADIDEGRSVEPRRKPLGLILAGVAAAVVLLGGIVWGSDAAGRAQAEAAAQVASASASASASQSKAARDAFWAQVAKDNARACESQRAEANPFNASQEHDRQMAADGWMPFVDGIYQSDAQFGCGSLSCFKFYINVTKPCPGSVYVEGAVMQKGISIGRANAWTSALHQATGYW